MMTFQLLSQLPNALLEEKVLSFLGVDDITRLSMTNRAWEKRMNSKRGGFPLLLREERRSTKMAYDAWGRNGGTTVYQVQPFRFLLKTEKNTVFQVEIKLYNEVWDELQNSRIMELCRRSDQFPGKTLMKVKILRKEHEMNSTVTFFERDFTWSNVSCGCGEFSCGFCRGFTVLYDEEEASESMSTSSEAPRAKRCMNTCIKRVFCGICSSSTTENEEEEEEESDTPTLTPAGMESNLRQAMVYVHMCAERISEFPDGKVYPSLAYLMLSLPLRLRDFFPVGIADKFPNEMITDRRTVIEWSYRPARTMEEWFEKLPVCWGGHCGISELELDYLPWYRKTYWSRNLPSSIPTHHSDRLWGNVFVRGRKWNLGQSSYHFVSPEEGVYLSMEHHCLYELPQVFCLESRVIPPRAYLRNITFEGLTLTGDLLWQEDYETNYLGLDKFHYTMTFDSEFSCILSGKIIGDHVTRAFDIEQGDFAEESDIRINAGLWNSIGDEAARSGRSRQEVVEELLQRLRNEGARCHLLRAIERMVSQPNDPMDYTYGVDD